MERSEEFVVEDRLVTDVGGTIGASVLSTPGMVAVMERNSAILSYQHLPEGKATVGFEVCIKHVAAAAEGSSCRVRSTLREVVDDRKLRFDVEVTEGERTIGVGTHERRVIDVGGVKKSELLRPATPPAEGESCLTLPAYGRVKCSVGRWATMGVSRGAARRRYSPATPRARLRQQRSSIDLRADVCIPCCAASMRWTAGAQSARPLDGGCAELRHERHAKSRKRSRGLENSPLDTGPVDISIPGACLPKARRNSNASPHRPARGAMLTQTGRNTGHRCRSDDRGPRRQAFPWPAGADRSTRRTGSASSTRRDCWPALAQLRGRRGVALLRGLPRSRARSC